MNDRIRLLREQSLAAVPTISLERARLLTELYTSGAPERASVPVTRALAFKHILDHKSICINPGELIVGERGEAPKATPTYPEICTHTLQDFEILNSREKIPFRVSDEARQFQHDIIIPFWSGRSIHFFTCWQTDSAMMGLATLLWELCWSQKAHPRLEFNGHL